MNIYIYMTTAALHKTRAMLCEQSSQERKREKTSSLCIIQPNCRFCFYLYSHTLSLTNRRSR